jgi:hypothetical protein
MNRLGRAQRNSNSSTAQRFGAFDPNPVRLARKLVVHSRCLLKMRQICLLQVPPPHRVVPRGLLAHQAMRFARRHAKMDYKVFARQPVNLILEPFKPVQKCSALSLRNARSLVR